MNIPVQNIYYLLCYAWNKLEERDRVNVSIDHKTELLDLFAKVLINATRIVLKRGIEKSYVESTQEVVGVKGKLQVSQTFKSNLLYKQRTICTYDEFSSDILLNRILVTTLYNLSRTIGLDKQLAQELISLQSMLPGINRIEMSNTLFKQVSLNRNNRFYGFIINVCQLIFESILPSEKQGQYRFSDFTRDERKMNQLFEAFVRNFYKIEQHKFTSIRKESINWQFDKQDDISHQFLPGMETDISLENEEEKIIVDAKYYRETMAVRFDKEKIHSTNLYQLFSYLVNQEENTLKTQNATGILLYPTSEKEYDLHYKYRGHNIYIRTLNLNLNWRNISSRLKNIIEV